MNFVFKFFIFFFILGFGQCAYLVAFLVSGNASSPILGLSSAVLQALCVEGFGGSCLGTQKPFLIFPAMELALSLEKSTNEKLCSTCSVVEKNKDVQFVGGTSTVEAIKKISEYVAQL